MSYSKLHSCLVHSSLWTEEYPPRILFLTLLALCDRHGDVYGSRQGLQRAANIKDDEAGAAWTCLLSSDPDSSDRMRAPQNGGRRIEEIPGGFHLLNFDYYRGLRNEEERRKQNRDAQKKYRDRQNGKPSSAVVSHDKPASATVSHGQQTVTESKPIAESESEADQKKKRECRTGTPDARPLPPGFEVWWKTWPRSDRKDGKKACAAHWTRHGLEHVADRVLAALEVSKQSRDWTKNAGEFIPLPLTWLHRTPWLTDPAERGSDTPARDVVDEIYDEMEAKP